MEDSRVQRVDVDGQQSRRHSCTHCYGSFEGGHLHLGCSMVRPTVQQIGSPMGQSQHQTSPYTVAVDFLFSLLRRLLAWKERYGQSKLQTTKKMGE